MKVGVKSKLEKSLQAFERFDARWQNLELTPRQRMRLYLLGTTIALPLILLSVFYVAIRPNYQLSAAAEKLIGTADTTTMKGFKYNKADKAFYLNKSAIHTSEAAGSVKVGNSPTQPTYSLKLPTLLNKGISYYDDQSGLSFNLAPTFAAASGKQIDGHVVYPINHNEQAVYTVKTDGLKEDLLVNHKAGNSLSFSYKLNLPSSLIARQLPTGAVGIYSANPVLFGNISYGSAADQASVQKARQNSPKNYLVFALTTPTIFESGITSNPPGMQTSLSLKGDVLTLVASNLGQAHYPLTIDPSVVISAVSPFAAGNNEGGIGCISSNNICEAGLTGGSLSANSWNDCSSTSGCGYGLTQQNSGGRENAAAVAYNGYLYILGGTDHTGATLSTIEYSSLNSSNGTLSAPSACQSSGSGTVTGVWCASQYSLPSAAKNVAAVVYDGFLYVEDTFTGHSIFYASIDALGSNGDLYKATTCASSYTGTIWCPSDTSLTNSVTAASLVAYNGTLYLVGGVTGTCSSDSTYEKNVQYATINADGSTASWSGATSSNFDASNGHAYVAAAAYNGYLYVWGGLSGNSSCGAQSSSSALYYVNIASASPGSWTWTTSSVTLNVANMGYGVYDGYLYTVGGESWSANTPTTTNTVNYAAINSSGSVGSWQTNINNVSSGALCDTATAIYNGYLYNLGGSGGSSSTCGDSNNITDVIYNQIDATGSVGQFTSNGNTAFVNGRAGAGLAAVNGYLFVMGGTSASGGCTSSICNTVYQATIGSDGSIGAWAHSSHDMLVSLTNFAVATYNGYIYTVGGCSTAYTTSCTAVSSNTTYVAQVSSAGVLGAFTAQRNFTTDTASARYDTGAFAYAGYLYMVGGYSGASSPLSDMWSIQLVSTTGATTGTWTQISTSSDLSTTAKARGAFGYGIYGNYAYIAGGSTNVNTVTHCAVGSNPYYCNDIWYIQLNTSGGVSTAWTFASTFTSARQHPSLYTWNSYLYLSGGDQGSGTYFHDVQFTPLTNGVPGTVSTANSGSSVWSARTGQTAVAYDGDVYIIGGLVSASETGCTGSGSAFYCNESYYAPINAGGPGTLGSWSTNSNSLPTAITGASTVAYNGYLYVVGGQEATVTFNNNDAAHSGTCSGAQDNLTLPSNVYSINVVAIGGSAADNGAGNGTPGNLGGGGATVTSSFWISPGDTIDTLQGCEFGATLGQGHDGGGVTTFTAANGLGAAGGGATQAAAGSGTASDANNSSCTFSTAGTGSPANNPASDTSDGGNGGCSNHGWYGGGGGGGYYAGGGGGGGNSSSAPGVSATQGGSSAVVWDANLSGNLRLAQAGGGGGAGVGTLAAAGGNGGNAGCGSQTNVAGGESCASIGGNGGGNGVLGQNGAASASGTGRGGGGGGGSSYCNSTYAATNATFGLSDCNSALNPIVHGVAGTDADGSVKITYTPVEPYAKYAQIMPDGSVGAFSSDTHKFVVSTASAVGAGEGGLAAAAYNGYLYIAGGSDGQEDTTNVQYAQLPTNGGALTSNWTQTTNSFTTAREYANLVAYNGYLYLMGGRNSTFTTYYSDVQYALICTGINNGVSGCNSTVGNVGTWSTSSQSLPAVRAVAGATIYDGYVYVAGGQQDTTAANIRQNTVFYNQLNPSGGDFAGAWKTTTGFSMARYGPTLAAYDGYLYLSGGNSGSDATDTQYAAINSNGTIGSWSTTPTSFTTGREEGNAVAYNGYLYIIGGNATGTLKSDVQYAGINAIPRVGLYTYRADNSANTNPIEILTAGSATNNLGDNTSNGPGGAIFSYQFATTNSCSPPTWNTVTSLTNLPANFMSSSGKLIPLTLTSACPQTPQTTNVAEYALFSYKLDDSLTATFPDSASNHTTVTNFNYFYHPNVGNRLRGGATFAGNSLQSLDAPP